MNTVFVQFDGPQGVGKGRAAQTLAARLRKVERFDVVEHDIEPSHKLEVIFPSPRLLGPLHVHHVHMLPDSNIQEVIEQAHSIVMEHVRQVEEKLK